MRRDHRPYFIKKAHLKFQQLYAGYFLKPQLDYLGQGFTITNPWNVKIFGSPITIGEHDIYNRIDSMGNPGPVRIEKNAWIGDSAIVCKGVTIGENSIVGAGSVVISSIPPNTIAAGNPAKVVKHLDPEKKFVKRSEWFADPAMLAKEIDEIDRDKLKRNTIGHWLRTLVFPKNTD